MCMCCEPTVSGRGFGTSYMCCWCAHRPMHRCFLSKEEEIEMLEKYKKELEKEIQGVKQKLQEIKG